MSYSYYIPGVVLIGASLLIVAFPQILVALVAGLIFMAGVGALWMGNTMRQIDKNRMDGSSGGPMGFFYRRWRP